jgi:hypothetical protein
MDVRATWCWIAAFSALAVGAPSAPAAAAAPADAYIAGYAAAVLERELRVSPRSLRVEQGVIVLDAADVKAADRPRVTAALARVRGVTRVEIVAAPAPPTAAPATPVPAPERPTPVTVASSLSTGLFPGGQLFTPLIADPRWPHFAAAYHGYTTDRGVHDVAAVSFGETFTLYRDRIAEGWWEAGIQAGVFAVFDLDAPSKDLVNADYLVAFALAYRLDRLAALVRLFHQSSHLGDEFLLGNRVSRLNLSYEAFDAKVSYELFGDVLRVYGGGGYLLAREPGDLKPGSLQWGVEFRSPWPAPGAGFRPIAAADVQNREENSWHVDLSLRAGVEVPGVLGDRKLQFLLEYFRGYSPNGQFYREKVEYLGLGVHFHF